MGKLIVFFLTLFLATMAFAGDVTLNWTNPTKGETCTDAGAITLTGVRIWQLVAQIDNPSQTSYVVNALKPGEYLFAATALDDQDNESRISGRASKTVDSFVAKVGAQVYQSVSIKGGYWLLPVGTIKTETACDITQSVNGKYAVPLSAVDFTGTTEPLVVLADCG